MTEQVMEAGLQQAMDEFNTAFKSSYEVIMISFFSVLFGAIGDKTFFISAFMSMRYNRLVVFLGAALALCLILGLSATFGAMFLSSFDQGTVNIIITTMCIVIGIRLIYEFLRYTNASESGEKIEAENIIKQAEKQMAKNETRGTAQSEAGASNQKESVKELVKKPSNFVLFVQMFGLIFVGELGDRSQLYTIALSSRNPPVLVFLGAYMAHMVAIVVAVVFGKYIASRVNEKWLILAAGLLYLGLGAAMYFE